MNDYTLGHDAEQQAYQRELDEWAWHNADARTYTREDKSMSTIKDIYGGGKGLKADDLKGRSHLLKISDVRIHKFDEGEKLVLSFQGREKELVLNKTNAQMIASKHGEDYDRWSGCEIEVYPDKTQFNGALVDCIRVRFPIPAATDSGEEIPF
jgi:hypothetical protein